MSDELILAVLIGIAVFPIYKACFAICDIRDYLTKEE